MASEKWGWIVGVVWWAFVLWMLAYVFVVRTYDNICLLIHPGYLSKALSHVESLAETSQRCWTIASLCQALTVVVILLIGKALS